MPVLASPTRPHRRSANSPLARAAVAAAACVVVLAPLSACASTSGPVADATASGSQGSKGLSTSNPNLFASVAADRKAADLLPARVKSSKVLSVAMNLTTPPTKFLATDGTSPLGTNPDLARLLARILGVKLDVRDVQFDGIIPGLESGQFDFAVASMGVTSERTQVLDMIDYARWGSLAVAIKGKGVDVSALCGLRVGVQQGTLQQAHVLPSLSKTCTSEGKKAIGMVSLPSMQDAVTQLVSGRLDAAFGDTPNMAYAVTKQPGRLETAGKEINPLPVTLATKKGSDLTPALLAAMQRAATLPEYRQIFQAWGLPNAAVTKVGNESKS